jgi:CheY-like chemotaxis protein
VSATAPLGASERIRVLVVDDNDGFRESLVFLLSGEDLEVIGQARTGPEAV